MLACIIVCDSLTLLNATAILSFIPQNGSKQAVCNMWKGILKAVKSENPHAHSFWRETTSV